MQARENSLLVRTMMNLVCFLSFRHPRITITITYITVLGVSYVYKDNLRYCFFFFLTKFQLYISPVCIKCLASFREHSFLKSSQPCIPCFTLGLCCVSTSKLLVSNFWNLSFFLMLKIRIFLYSIFLGCVVFVVILQ